MNISDEKRQRLKDVFKNQPAGYRVTVLEIMEIINILAEPDRPQPAPVKSEGEKIAEGWVRTPEVLALNAAAADSLRSMIDAALAAKVEECAKAAKAVYGRVQTIYPELNRSAARSLDEAAAAIRALK